MGNKLQFNKFVSLVSEPGATHNRRVTWAARITEDTLAKAKRRFSKPTAKVGDWILLLADGHGNLMTDQEFNEYFPNRIITD